MLARTEKRYSSICVLYVTAENDGELADSPRFGALCTACTWRTVGGPPMVRHLSLYPTSFAGLFMIHVTQRYGTVFLDWGALGVRKLRRLFTTHKSVLPGSPFLREASPVSFVRATACLGLRCVGGKGRNLGSTFGEGERARARASGESERRAARTRAMGKDTGCNVCRVCCVGAILLILIGGGAVGVYFAIQKKGVANLDETTNTKAESKQSGTSDGSNFADRDKAPAKDTLFYGMNYSPFGMGDNRLCKTAKKGGTKLGGLCLLADQVQADMRQIAGLTARIKTYSLNCLPQTKSIVKYAEKHGMKVVLGVWVDKDPALNKIEIKRLVELLGELGNAGGAITDLCVGNEALFVGKVDRKELIRMIKTSRDAVNGAGLNGKIKIGTAEIFSAWSGRKNSEFKGGEGMFDVAKECDFIGLNTHPYYAGVDPVNTEAGAHVLGEKEELTKIFGAKGFKQPIIITETGFPTGGKSRKVGSKTVTPSVEGASKFTTQVEDISRKEELPVYYFEPFDGDWKRRWAPFTEADYTFGLHKCNRKLKAGMDLPLPGAGKWEA